ncbi:Hypp6176 [Branchiostoma lanceolatum]|uniref:Hypp6176 protein n=1 Tax=Branchiostoma lanceolatum TaxID=7740 RepID=A0A8J9W5Z2_BRALA|nr:Hypp6176 [Branchiostoma lanceolatum]
MVHGGGSCALFLAFKTVVIKDGKVVVMEKHVSGRKVPLKEIQQKLLEKHVDLGYMRPQQNCKDIDYASVTKILKSINEDDDDQTLQVKQEKLSTITSTSHLCRWHDHSTLLSTWYLLVTVHPLYDPAIFYTSEEMRQQGKPMDVQSLVEEPEVYLLARSKSTIADQLKYARCQREDIKAMQDTNYQDVKIRDVVRYFTGDDPAQWVESGEQHQGTYGCSAGCGAPIKRFMDLGYCLRLQVKSLEDRRQLITSLPAGARGGSAPFKGLNKDQLIQNLNATGYDYDLECNKPELKSQLKQHLAGASHIPALLYDEQQSTLKAINLEQYAVSSCESLHNAKEHIKNLLEELPNHVNQQDKASVMEVQSAFQGKEVMRGSDFRKLLISVTAHLAAHGGDPKVVELLNTPSKTPATGARECGSYGDEADPADPVTPPSEPEILKVHSLEYWDGEDIETEEWHLEDFIWRRCTNCKTVRECVCCYDLSEAKAKAVDATRKTLEGNEYISSASDPNLRPWKPDGKHAIFFKQAARLAAERNITTTVPHTCSEEEKDDDQGLTTQHTPSQEKDDHQGHTTLHCAPALRKGKTTTRVIQHCTPAD